MGSSPSRPTLSVAGATGQRRRLLSARLPVRVWGDARLVRVTGHPAAFSARKLRVRVPHELPCRCHPDGTGSRTFNPAVARSIRVSGTAGSPNLVWHWAHNPAKCGFKSRPRYEGWPRARTGKTAKRGVHSGVIQWQDAWLLTTSQRFDPSHRSRGAVVSAVSTPPCQGGSAGSNPVSLATPV